MRINFFTRYSIKKSIKFSRNSIFFLPLLVICVSLVLSVGGWLLFSQGYLQPAKYFFLLAQPVSKTTSLVFLQRWPVINFWHETNQLGVEVSQVLLTAQRQEQPLNWLLTTTANQSLLTNLEQTLKSGESSWLIKKLATKQGIELTEFQDLLALSRVLIQEKNSAKKYLLVFQNTDEIRATGGFIGSYAVLDFAQADFTQLEIRDIYDPSGISPSLPAPVGHDLYLSENQGLKLHDANWNPEFSASAQDILWFFARIEDDPQTYDGVIAINFSTVEKLVSLLGEIYLPDEKVFVEASDLATLLRSNRADFFAGSKQKEHELDSFKTALLLKIQSLSKSEFLTVAKQLLNQGLWREVQFFATDEVVEKQLVELGVAGELYAYQPNELFIFPVESNVGINKANRWLTREITTEQTDQLLRLTISFNNQATLLDRPAVTVINNPAYKTAGHLGYINYYRIITSSNLYLISVKVGEEVLTSWDKTSLTAANGQLYFQHGFLVTVPEASNKTVVLDFSRSDEQSDYQQLVIQKQAGLSYQNRVAEFLKTRFWLEDVE